MDYWDKFLEKNNIPKYSGDIWVALLNKNYLNEEGSYSYHAERLVEYAGNLYFEKNGWVPIKIGNYEDCIEALEIARNMVNHRNSKEIDLRDIFLKIPCSQDILHKIKVS
jgi:hypothetical protein